MDSCGQDWERLYLEGDTGWDLRGITPPLAELLAREYLGTLGLRSPARTAVPGCGRGHDLRALAVHGCQVTGFDVAPSACAEATALLRLNRVEADVHCRDVLGLVPEFAGRFDLVSEYTCVCALAPRLRSASRSRADTPRQGRPDASARPCTGLWPTRRPVHEPGPAAPA